MGIFKGLNIDGMYRRPRSNCECEIDCSKGTVNSDTSEDSVMSFPDHKGRKLLKSCLKVPTQRESLARMDSGVKTVRVHSPELHPVSENIVRFESVEFRQYVRVLSDNPSTSSGPPIGLGWEFIPEDTIKMDVDLYERGCEDLRLRRSRDELVIPRHLRETMLREAGYSRSDIVNAIRGVKKDKVRRNVSFHNQKYEPIVERVESVRYCVKGLNIRRKAKIGSFAMRWYRRQSSTTPSNFWVLTIM